MQTRPLTTAVLALLLTVSIHGAPAGPSLQFNPVSCLKGGELPLLQVRVQGDGELRGYFRRANATDWCSVEGTNNGPLSRVVLPRFEAGDEIEYFFVLLDGQRVVARSPQIYRSRVSAECQTASARHIVRLSMNCTPENQAIPSSVAAGYALNSNLVEGEPPYGSPDRP